MHWSSILQMSQLEAMLFCSGGGGDETWEFHSEISFPPPSPPPPSNAAACTKDDT